MVIKKIKKNIPRLYWIKYDIDKRIIVFLAHQIYTATKAKLQNTKKGTQNAWWYFFSPIFFFFLETKKSEAHKNAVQHYSIAVKDRLKHDRLKSQEKNVKLQRSKDPLDCWK